MKQFKLAVLIFLFGLTGFIKSDKKRIEIENVSHIEISYQKNVPYQLSEQQIKSFIEMWNNSKSEGLCICYPRFAVLVHMKDGTVRSFRATDKTIKEDNDICFVIGDTLFLKNIWNSRPNLSSQKIFTGDWVNEKYVKEIRNGMLISDAQHDGILISFDKDNDSIGYANLYFHAGPAPFEIIKRDSVCQFTGNAFGYNDTIFNVKIISYNKIMIGKNAYLRLDDSIYNELYILEKYLFNGKYKMQDGHEVEFTDYGTITGLDSNKYYNAEYDYTAGPDFSINRISIGKKENRLYDYGFKYIGDTLFICQINKDKRDTTDEPSGYKRFLGKVLYRMWRE